MCQAEKMPTKSWTCDECHAMLTVDTMLQISRKRDNHIAFFHPDVPRSRFHVLRELVQAFQGHPG